MDKESIYELQKIDCNCNDCAFLVRDIDKFKANAVIDNENQLFLFENRKAKMIERAKIQMNFNKEKGEKQLQAAHDLKYQYQGQQCPILYGICSKLHKAITFIANICQLDTQTCFVHRKDQLYGENKI